MTGTEPVAVREPTVGAALQAATSRLRAAGVSNPALDARLLMAAALGAPVERVIMWPDRAVADGARAMLDGLVERRVARVPMAQLLGKREFWSLDFAVTRDTLTPRPESEALVAAVVDAMPGRQGRRRILDLGCGTGCLLVTLLVEFREATGIGIDVSEPALAVARRNAAALGVADRAHWALGDWGSAMIGPFDVIVCNPPYVRSGDIAGLEPDVREHEPRLALDGGPDGLDAYRRLAPDIARLLGPTGVAAVEVGAGQADAVAGLIRTAGLQLRARRRDLAGRERCLVFAPPEQK